MADKPDENEIAEDEEAEASEDGGEDGEQEPAASKWRPSRRTLIMFGTPAVLLLGGGAWFARGYIGIAGAGDAGQGPPQKLYYDLPEMVVNLSSQGERDQYLKLKVALEAPSQKALNALNPIMPRVLDMFQLYLRELRGSDLEGSAGIYRLKEELLRRINLEIHPHQIDRVLFKEIIVQ